MAGRGLIRAYLRQNLRVLLLLTALILLFAGVCFLYGLPREAAGYCIALAAFLLPTCAGVIGCLAVAQISGLFVA